MHDTDDAESPRTHRRDVAGATLILADGSRRSQTTDLEHNVFLSDMVGEVDGHQARLTERDGRIFLSDRAANDDEGQPHRECS